VGEGVREGLRDDGRDGVREGAGNIASGVGRENLIATIWHSRGSGKVKIRVEHGGYPSMSTAHSPTQ
jgi:hypothetical protein